MSVCRPRGGKRSPRYFEHKNASESRLWRLMHPGEEEQEEQTLSKADELVLTMQMYQRAMDAMLAAAKEKMK